jgi:hypothetical protein
VFWQRVYLQCLEQVVAEPPPSYSVPRSMAILAGEHASEAVREFDAWETQQRRASPENRQTVRDPGDAEGDDPDDGYLGR